MGRVSYETHDKGKFPPLHSVSRPFFTADNRCVHCAVRTEYVDTISLTLAFEGPIFCVVWCSEMWQLVVLFAGRLLERRFYDGLSLLLQSNFKMLCGTVCVCVCGLDS